MDVMDISKSSIALRRSGAESPKVNIFIPQLGGTILSAQQFTPSFLSHKIDDANPMMLDVGFRIPI